MEIRIFPVPPIYRLPQLPKKNTYKEAEQEKDKQTQNPYKFDIRI